MTEEIDQFMWSFQRSFRLRVEINTKLILDQLGMSSSDVRVILVGIATQDDARHAICVEPETGPLQPRHLLKVPTRAQEMYESDPESQVRDSHPRAHVSVHRQLFLSARAKAVSEAVEKARVFGNLTFFVSQSSSINGYEVHTCICIPKGAIMNLPAFKEDTVDRISVGKSIQHEVIKECLRRSDKALYIPNPGDGTEMPILGRPQDIITSAAERFIEGTLWRTANQASDLFSALNEVSSLTYERSGAKGGLTVTSYENLEKWLTVRFSRPVPLRESRTLRKILQLSDDTISVMADQTRAYGLGVSKTAPDVLEISMPRHAEWDASVNGEKFLTVRYGKVTIPSQPLELERLIDIAERTIGSANTRRIWEIVEAAQASGKGRTIVVSKNPEAETTRLSGEGMPIEPDYLDAQEVVRLGSVDGAVIIGPDGRCYAFGVILDGAADEKGDRARGSRFNSAVRYQNAGKEKSMIVVISDDGTIDLLPQLMPRVYRGEVARAVDAFCEYCQSPPIDGEEFAKLYEKVKDLEFYLNEDQCSRVNNEHEQEMERRLEAGGIRIIRRNLEPSPRMDDSYFWEP